MTRRNRTIRAERILLVLLALAFLAGIAFARAVGAHTWLTLQPKTQCLADGSVWVEWSFGNPNAQPFIVHQSTPPLPPQLDAHSTTVAVEVVPPGWAGTVWADIRGHFPGHPGEGPYRPDTEGNLQWSTGDHVTITPETCGPETGPTPTSPPRDLPPLYVPDSEPTGPGSGPPDKQSTPTDGTSSAPATPNTPAGIITTGTGSPTITGTPATPPDAGTITPSYPTTRQTPDTVTDSAAGTSGNAGRLELADTGPGRVLPVAGAGALSGGLLLWATAKIGRRR